MIIPSLFYGTIVGTIVGLVWAFGLNIGFSTSIPIGAIVGLIVALALHFSAKQHALVEILQLEKLNLYQMQSSPFLVLLVQLLAF